MVYSSMNEGEITMANSIPVYSVEVEAGIGKAVAEKSVLAYMSPVLVSPDALKKHIITAALARASIGEDVTFDLYPIHTILVTTGWNNNDDIFTKGETWAARLTPEDKPFNMGHEPRQIIGHITANTVVDDALTVIDPTLPFDEIPDKFHILTSAVIYRHLQSRDDTLEAEASKLIESIQNGDWCVSMECLFSDFDYGITYANGEHQIVTRNSQTAFLTKHLRIHGGYGEHNGGKLGRVLRHITFSGKGLVENPANPDSVIFNDTTQFSGITVEWKCADTAQARNENSGERHMAEAQDKFVAKLEDQVKALNDTLAAANLKIEELGEAQVKSALAEKETVITDLQTQLTQSKAKIEELTGSYNEAVAAKTELETAKTEAETKLTEAVGKLGEYASIAKTAERVAQLVDLKVDKSEAEKIVAEFADLDDEKFASVADLVIAKYTSDEEKKKSGKAKAADTDDEDDSAGAAAADSTNLGDAEPEIDATLASGDGDDSDELMTSLAGFLDTVMHGE